MELTHGFPSDIASLLASYGITVVPNNHRCLLNETHARGTIEGLFKRHGEAHLDLVLRCVTADPSNRVALWSELLAAVSDFLLLREAWPRELVLNAFREIDLQAHRKRSVRLRPWPVRHTLRSFIDIDLERLNGNPICSQ